MRGIIGSLVALSLTVGTGHGFADDPLKKLLPGGKADTLSRLPDDQIEGTIWEYKGTLKDKLKEGEEAPTLEGRFRTENKAVFDSSRRLPLPEKKQVGKAVKSAKEGNLKDLKLPDAPQEKRLGQYHTLKDGRLRLDFDDKDGLNGIMIVRLKKKTEDVWIGTYTEKKGKKVVQNWNVELRPLED